MGMQQSFPRAVDRLASLASESAVFATRLGSLTPCDAEPATIEDVIAFCNKTRSNLELLDHQLAHEGRRNERSVLQAIRDRIDELGCTVCTSNNPLHLASNEITEAQTELMLMFDRLMSSRIAAS